MKKLFSFFLLLATLMVSGNMWAGASDNYLCLTAEKAGSTVTLTTDGSPAPISLKYSTNGEDWSPYVVGQQVTLSNEGDLVYFRAGVGGNTHISTGSRDIYWFKLSGRIAASGNIMSLLDSTCNSLSIPCEWCFYKLFAGVRGPDTALTVAPELPAINLASNCYTWMFVGCIHLTQAPLLPATTLAKGCYEGMFMDCSSLIQAPALPAEIMQETCYKSLFDGCSSLTQAPELPSTKLASYCYEYMFEGCSSLIQAPALPATTLPMGCYYKMFNGCSSLTQSPVLPATTLADWCCYQMFQNCSNLNTITCLATKISGHSTDGWAVGVAETGTFLCANNMSATWTNGSSGIPVGWTTKYIHNRDVTIPESESYAIGTVCLPGTVSAVDIPVGVTFYKFLGYKGNSVYFTQILDSAELTAGYPYVFKTTNGTLSMIYSTDILSVPVATTGLKGVFTEKTFTTSDTDGIYAISDNKIMKAQKGSKVPAYRAYIDLNGINPLVEEPAVAPGRLLTFTVDNPIGPTHLQPLVDEFISDTYKVIRHGQLYIMRGNEIYNVQGQIVNQ